MDRRTYLTSVGTITATGTLAGCADDESGDEDEEGTDDETTNGERDDGEYGVLSTSVTDQPNDIDHFESLVVTLQGVWIKPSESNESDAESTEENETAENETTENETGTEENADNETETEEPADTESDDGEQSSGRYYLEFDEPQQAELVDLQGENIQLIDETEVAVGEYQFLQLDVSDTKGVLEETGEEAIVETPGNAPLQFQQSFEIRPDEYTYFIADFTPFQQGNGEYIIRPVARGTQVFYGDEDYDTDEGGFDGNVGEGSEERDNETDGTQDNPNRNGN